METQRREIDPRKKKKMLEMKKKMNKLTKEQLKAAVEKKKVCNAKAMSVVERLIEPDVEEIWLLESLFHINQCHYQDAVEERAIMKFCGYPLCDESLDDVPKKQFHISTKQNKVFDITDRKNYCSNVCYKASIFLKDQLYTSPLWLRDCEDIVQFKLFTPGSKLGPTGVEIDLGNINPIKTVDLELKTTANMEVEEEPLGQEKVIKILDSQNTISSVEKLEDLSKNELKCNLKSNDETAQKENNTLEKNHKPIAINDKIVESSPSKNKQEQTDGKQQKTNKRTREKSRVKKDSMKSDDRILNIGDRIDIILDSWFTVDSLFFLYGDDRVKEMLEEFGSPSERFGQLKNTKDAFLYERYTEICKRLNFIELKEKIEERDDEVLPTKPLPNYEQLKAEAKELEIKVRSFFAGDKKVSFQDGVEENEKDQKQNQNGLEENTAPPILPLLDKHCVLATRRRIVLDRLFKTLPDIQSALGLAQFYVRHEVQEFVHTLALTASNIVLSPSEWNLISIIIIKLFTLRNELLDYAFKTDLTQKRIINLLLSYRLDLGYLQVCVSKLSNIEQIIKNSQ